MDKFVGSSVIGVECVWVADLTIQAQFGDVWHHGKLIQHLWWMVGGWI